MTTSNVALEGPSGVESLAEQAGGGTVLVEGFAIPSSLSEFVYSDKYLTLAVDPEGLTTPEVSLAKLTFHAKRMVRGEDWTRRSRAVWVFKTEERLKEHERAFLDAFPDSVPSVRREHAFTARFGCDIECEVLFRVCEKLGDASRVPPASFFIFDDFYEAGAEVFSWAANRVGLYPDRESGRGCVTEDDKRNRIIWGMARSSWGIHYLDGMKADLEDHVHITRLHQEDASGG